MKTIKLTKHTFKEKEREILKGAMCLFAIFGAISFIAVASLYREIKTPLIFPYTYMLVLCMGCVMGFTALHINYKEREHIPALSRV